jgi:hypothetical protein
MENAPNISLRQAAAAFGPCAGGTENAQRIITDRLKDDDLFWRQIVCDEYLWDSDFITTEVPPSADWFRQFFDLTIEQQGNAHPEFVDLHSQITSIFLDTDNLVMFYDQVRSMWIEDDYAHAYRQIEAKTEWSFIQALAWVATRDRNVVSAMLPTKANSIGWLTCLAAERCLTCKSGASATPKWQHCQCMVSSLKNLKAFAKKHGHEIEPDLMISIENGTVELVGLPTADTIMLDAAKVMVVFPEKVPDIKSIRRGRPKTAHHATDLIQQKMADGTFTGNISKLARLVAGKLAEIHANTDTDPPKYETIRYEIRRLIREQQKPE